MREEMGTRIEMLDFAMNREISCKKINEIVKERTHGLIPQTIALEQLSIYTRLMLINTIFFKGLIHFFTTFFVLQISAFSWFLNWNIVLMLFLYFSLS